MSIVGIALLLALCIPIIAILLDSPFGRALAKRVETDAVQSGTEPEVVAELEHRLQLLEAEVEMLQDSLVELREESQFLQRLLEDKRDPPSLPPERV